MKSLMKKALLFSLAALTVGLAIPKAEAHDHHHYRGGWGNYNNGWNHHHRNNWNNSWRRNMNWGNYSYNNRAFYGNPYGWGNNGWGTSYYPYY